MWYILIEFADGRRGYQVADTSGVAASLVDLDGAAIADAGNLEYRVIDATPPRPAWAGPEPSPSLETWEPRDA